MFRKAKQYVAEKYFDLKLELDADTLRLLQKVDSLKAHAERTISGLETCWISADESKKVLVLSSSLSLKLVTKIWL